MNEKRIMIAARLISMVFTPFYLPLVGLIALFAFSYLNTLPMKYIFTSLLVVYVFTVLLPTLLIHLYRKYQGWTPLQSALRERRIVPYAISILCYLTCFYVMSINRMPHFIGSILVAALIIQVFCALINGWWKISTHTAAIGGVAGGLIAFSAIFNFDPVWWLCLVLILAGMVGTSRMILRQHSLAQVLTGFAAGLFIAFFTIILV